MNNLAINIVENEYFTLDAEPYGIYSYAYVGTSL